MANSETGNVEVKVGALILVSIGVIVLFVLVMGGVSFEKTYPLFVDFDNPGGLAAGAPVRIAGVKVGKVKELAFEGGRVDPKTGRRTLVRATLAVEARVKDSIHEDADFYVTTQGVLGEQYLAIEPGTPTRAVLAENSIVKGIDPPRLDLFLAKAFELLDTTVNGIKNNRELIGDIALNTASLLKGLNGVLTDNKDRIARTLANIEALSAEANQLTHDARLKYVDNPKIARTIDNVERISTDLSKDTGPMLEDARQALANLNRASNVIGSPEQQQKITKALNEVVELATRANAAAADAQAIVAHIKKGEGTVGAVVMDEALYDDLQELLRDLKHNPWKFFWRE
jgi:phospholipid/cholesterol/gamma-HCH transport system substrate-binding protein